MYGELTDRHLIADRADQRLNAVRSALPDRVAKGDLIAAKVHQPLGYLREMIRNIRTETGMLYP